MKKIAIVTGGASGIGLACAERLIEPAEVAGFAAYLCSDAAGTITGSALTMDLGWTAR